MRKCQLRCLNFYLTSIQENKHFSQNDKYLVYTEIRVPRKFRCLKHNVSRLGTQCFAAWNTMFQGLEHGVSRLGTRCFAAWSTMFQAVEQNVPHIGIPAPSRNCGFLHVARWFSSTLGKPPFSYFDENTRTFWENTRTSIWDLGVSSHMAPRRPVNLTTTCLITWLRTIQKAQPPNSGTAPFLLIIW